MMPVRSGSLLMALLFVTTVLAGCHGLEDSDPGGPSPSPTASESPNATASPSPSPTGTPDPDPEPEAPKINVTIVDAPDSITVGDTVTIQINVTGDSVQAETAHIAYNNTTTLEISKGELTLENFTGTRDGNGNVTFPGNYSVVDWTIDVAESMYIRAHVVVDGYDFWSDEHVIVVNEEDADPGVGKLWTVTIGGGFDANNRDVEQPAPHCPFATYKEEDSGETDITIQVGDKVRWQNLDPPIVATGCTHTATSSSVPSEADGFDTGVLAQGDVSEEFQFLVPGVYEYACDVHETMAGAKITVVA